MTLRRIAAAAALLLPLAACNSTEPGTGGCATPAALSSPVPIENTTFAPELGVNLSASTKTASGLFYRDIRVGTGATLANGSTTTVKYTGSFSNGCTFDAGNFGLTLPGNVIKGWQEGLLGMKIGGARQLIIPPSLGYGASGSGPIPANAVLVFTVEPQ